MARSWDVSTGEKPRPARDVEIRYGHGLLKQESARWPRYVAVSTQTAWRVAQPFLSQPPAGVGIVEYLDWGHLEEVSNGLPGDAELVVGIGGGVPLDASKYAALRKDLPLVLVPSIVSTGAIIHGVFSKWEGRVFLPAQTPFCDCEHVLVDYDYVLQAPDYLNIAGLGDVLCGFAGIAEWRYKAARGTAPPIDVTAVESTLDHHREIAGIFPSTLVEGNLTSESIRFIMKAVQERDDRLLVNDYAPVSDHAFPVVIEMVADRRLIHGEMTALGSAIVSWAAGQRCELVERLERSKVRFRPGDIGLTRDELRQVLEDLVPYLENEGVKSVVASEPIVGARFDALWDYLEGKPTESRSA